MKWIKAGSAFVLMLAALALSPAQVAAADPALTLSVKPQPDKPPAVTLTARLQGAAPASGAGVDFFVVTEEFGQGMEVPVGSADLPANGTASLSYVPTWSGSTKFVARLSGPGSTGVKAATTTYDVTASADGVYAKLANEPRPFGSIGPVFLGALLVTVALVWLTLLATVVRVARALPRLASEDVVALPAQVLAGAPLDILAADEATPLE